MPSCEKCWADAYMRVVNHPMKSQTEHYIDLLKERKDKPCTPEEQKYGRKVKMNKSIIVLCKNHGKCNHNDKGDCKLDHVSFMSEGGLKQDRLICEDFEPIPEVKDDS